MIAANSHSVPPALFRLLIANTRLLGLIHSCGFFFVLSSSRTIATFQALAPLSCVVPAESDGLVGHIARQSSRMG